MAVLVIGGAGYIGSHAARALRRAGHQVIIFDNLSTGYEILANGFELVKGDVLDASSLLPAISRADAVMHFAAFAYVGESVSDPKKYFHNNVEGGLSLLNAALEAGVKKIIFSSTCAVYGEVAKVPIDENIPREPVNPYGVTKLFFEQALEAYDRAYGFRFAALRYFNAAGADVDGKTIFAGGEMVESFDVRGGKIVDVDVVADAGAVGRGIVGAEDVQLWALARCGAEGERDQMCFGIVEFADFSAFVGTGGVEITQGGEAEAVGAVVGFEGLLEE